MKNLNPENVIKFQGNTYINTTPHNINLKSTLTEEEFTLPASGILINGKPEEVTAGGMGSIKFVKTTFVSNPEDIAKINILKQQYPNCIIIGSIIAAQAYPGKVCGMVPYPGLERVPVAEKKMQAEKFTIF